MTIAIDTEISSTHFDPASQTNFYTVERGGRHWTVAIPTKHLDAHGPLGTSKAKRRDHVARLLTDAMQGPSDEDRQKPGKK